MARYFYDFSAGHKIMHDEYGVVCADDESAVIHAWSALPRMMAETDVVLPWQHFEMIIRREDGVHIGRVSVSAAVETQNPATAMILARDRTKPISRIF